MSSHRDVVHLYVAIYMYHLLHLQLYINDPHLDIYIFVLLTQLLGIPFSLKCSFLSFSLIPTQSYVGISLHHNVRISGKGTFWRANTRFSGQDQ